MTDPRRGLKGRALTLAADDRLTGLAVYPIDRPHQRTLVETARTAAAEAGPDAGIRGRAVFRKPRIPVTFSEPLRRRSIVGFPRFRSCDLVAASSYDDARTGDAP
jgi:hypothetical protein